MTTRRIIRYYPPRIQIPVDDMLDDPSRYAVYCLPIDGAEALLRICDYLKREVAYIDEIIDDKVFYGPSETDLETIRDLVGETEVGLMAGCDFSTIEGILGQIRDAISVMAQCTCDATTWQQNQSSRVPDLSGYVDEGSVTYKTPTDAEVTYTPFTSDADRCELAQAFYWYIYKAFSEDILPKANSTADAITAAIIATATFTGIATWVGVPVAVLTVIVTSVVAWGIDGAIAEFLNWLFASKDEIICALYQGFPDLALAASNVKNYVNEASEPSFLDKAVLNSMLASVWHMTAVIADQQANGTWDAYIEAGLCSSCDPIPAGCLPVEACDVGDWDGGTVECVSGRAVVKGGITAYTKNSRVVPSYPVYVKLDWIPRSDGGPTASCKFGVRIVGDTTWWDVCTTPSRAVDVETSDYCTLPGSLSGQEVELAIRQIANWCEPVYWCLLTEEPT